MIDVADNPRAVAGDNNPPAFIAFERDIEDLNDQAKQFLDGSDIETEGQAIEVARILDAARKTWKGADEQRKIEKRPHDEAAQAVQDTWNPLLTKAKRVEIVAKAAQTKWLAKVEAEQRAKAEAARIEAERLEREAREAMAAASGGNLAEHEAAEEALKLAKRATKDADRLDKAKPQVAGVSRAISLRTSYAPTLVDPVKALQHYRTAQPEALKAWLLEQAQRDVRSGSRSIPGFDIKPERTVA